ncbi:unnamed protein product [Ranitomeya imitator]|uniref:G-protein coupled receptors family 1 profile domain-containing protein n=1 Tax=Ranitomeya imitator TaxID=111125 RepID=A0ABN9LRW6_9NEOB|nr:unnamed protein product [Ranitomeya imitator]
MYASILLITSMSIDRFLAVAKPLASVTIRTRSTPNHMIFALWLLASLLAIPMPLYREVMPYNNKLLCIAFHGSSGHVIFQYLFEFITGFAFPFSIIISCYVYIGLRLRTAKFQTKHRTSRLVIMIVVTFALFWFPYQVMNFIQVTGELFSAEKLIKAAKTARPTATAFAFFSSSVNPILYVFAAGNFIKTAGAEFMAKLFEGIGADSHTLRKVSRMIHQKIREESVELDMSAASAASQTYSLAELIRLLVVAAATRRLKFSTKHRQLPEDRAAPTVKAAANHLQRSCYWLLWSCVVLSDTFRYRKVSVSDWIGRYSKNIGYRRYRYPIPMQVNGTKISELK